MTKDYKPRQSDRSRGSGLLVGLFVGFLLGMATAAAIAIYFFKTPIPFTSKTQPAAKPDAKAPAIGEDGKPRFDFYRILPGQEVPVTDRQLKDAAKAEAAAREATTKPETAPAAAASKDVYFIQAGAFQNPADADNLKAKLALMGLEAGVEPTEVPEKGTWYRVRLGPLTSLEEINRVRAQLAQNGINGSLVKVKTAP